MLWGLVKKRDESQKNMLSIKTSLPPETKADKRVKKSKIQIEFSDNGPGIPAEDLAKIFDPFYTTKEPGKGTGLGLSVSLRIVKDLGGDINVKSDAGKGAKIMVILAVDSATKSPRHKKLTIDN